MGATETQNEIRRNAQPLLQPGEEIQAAVLAQTFNPLLMMLYLPLINRTHAPLVIKSVGFTGRGIGTVIKVVQVNLAPAGYGGKDPRLIFDSDPLSTYGTDPPVERYGPGLKCHRQILRQVKGYRLGYNANARVWVVIRNLRPGRWTITSHVITYTQNGTTYRQAISLQAYGTVARHAVFTLDPNSEACLRPAGARVLPGWPA